MTHEFTATRRVEFHETDMAGIVHFSNFFRYMEATEHAFFRSLGIPLHVDDAGGMRGWARVDATCAYHRPAHYEDLLSIRLRVEELTSRSVRYRFTFRLADLEAAPGERPLAEGSLKVVHVARGPGEPRMRAAEMPSEVAAKLTVAPPDDA